MSGLAPGNASRHGCLVERRSGPDCNTTSPGTTGYRSEGKRATTVKGRGATVTVRKEPPQSALTRDEFHHHFKAVTGLSPAQFQKQLRLQEARRLMLGEDLDAASAGARVGYNAAAHFNREYKSLFGVPPMRDVQQLRAAARTSTDL